MSTFDFTYPDRATSGVVVTTPHPLTPTPFRVKVIQQVPAARAIVLDIGPALATQLQRALARELKAWRAAKREVQ